MKKKNPYVTTVGFNKDDPDHVHVAELLNSMGRGKAQYIVKAILIYQNLQQKGSLPQVSGGLCDYESIRRIVLQVLEEREQQTRVYSSSKDNEGAEQVQPQENPLLQEFDEEALNGIMASIAAFQEQ